MLERPLNIYLNNKDIHFPFFLIWANENWTRRWDGLNRKILIKQEYKDEDPENFIKDIKIYLIDSRYIEIHHKKVLGLYEPTKIPKLNKTLNIWRKKAREYDIGEIFILVCINSKIKFIKDNKNLFDGAYDFPPRNSFFKHKVKFKNTYIYSEIIYKNLYFEVNDINITEFPIYRGSMLEWDNSPRVKESNIYDYFSPEQFYLNNKIIIEWTKKNYNKNQFIFINAWNEWGEGTYLEPDEKYGYASINSLSKSLFNLSFIYIYNIMHLKENVQIAIHAHIYYEEFLEEIINKTNNIPCKFDLYISIVEIKIKDKMMNYIKRYSKANQYKIDIFSNKGRDVIPLFIQLKEVIKKYKYLCHIHTKKSPHISFGNEWREYLYNNLLGNKDIISEILTEFENNEKLGFIYPETYYKVLDKFGKQKHDSNYKYMNYILKQLFIKIRVLDNYYFDYPEGNMFWAKVDAVYQIFQIKIEDKFIKEMRKLNMTLIHGIERIWLFIVKLNGYYYKKIFKHE